MALARLVRRFFVCVIAGGLTYVVADRLTQPSPIWSMGLTDKATWELVPQDDATAPDGPVWLFAREPGQPDRLVAVSLLDGAAIETIPLPGAGTDPREWTTMRTLARGDVLVVRPSTEFHFVRRGRPVRSVLLEGRWLACENGTVAWRLNRTDDKFQFVDLSSGRIASSMALGARYSHVTEFGVAVSPDAKWLAVPQGDCLAADRRDGVELWDIASQKLVKRLMPSNPVEKGESHTVSFNRAGDRLTFCVRTPEGKGVGATYDLVNERWVDAAWEPESPPEMDRGVGVLADSRGLQVWIAVGIASSDSDPFDRSSFAVYRGTEALSPWRPLPMEAAFTLGGCCSGDRSEIRFASSPESLVLRGVVLPWWLVVPRNVVTFAASLSATFAPTEAPLVETLYWHNWKSGAWRCVGCTNVERGFQLRPEAVVVVSRGTDGRVALQSWRLPPSDFRLLTVALAALSSAAVWFWCRRRAVSRQKPPPA